MNKRCMHSLVCVNTKQNKMFSYHLACYNCQVSRRCAKTSNAIDMVQERVSKGVCLL